MSHLIFGVGLLCMLTGAGLADRNKLYVLGIILAVVGFVAVIGSYSYLRRAERFEAVAVKEMSAKSRH